MVENANKVIRPDVLTVDQQEVMELVTLNVPLGQIAKLTGKKPDTVERLFRSASVVLNANDDAVSDYLAFIDQWDKDNGTHLLEPTPAPKGAFDLLDEQAERYWENHARGEKLNESDQQPSRLVDGQEVGNPSDASTSYTADKIRVLGTHLLRLANAIDNEWSTEQLGTALELPARIDAIDHEVARLVVVAEIILEQVQFRRKLLNSDFLGDPCWYILIDLFVHKARAKKAACKELTYITGRPTTSTLRYIKIVEEHGFTESSKDPNDQRLTLHELTPKGVRTVGKILEKIYIDYRQFELKNKVG